MYTLFFMVKKAQPSCSLKKAILVFSLIVHLVFIAGFSLGGGKASLAKSSIKLQNNDCNRYKNNTRSTLALKIPVTVPSKRHLSQQDSCTI